ncbi:MAG: FAD-binding protein [Methanomassiliicoccales archaeon]|nr:MAG: FAD-binding protein [Methanomassiliicoccales archaeon]
MMRTSLPLNVEVAVIGNGAAGQACAWNLAKKGMDVAVIGRGTSATEMSTGCALFGGNLKMGSFPEWSQACDRVEELVLGELPSVGLEMEGRARKESLLITAEGTLIREHLVQKIIFNGRAEAIGRLKVGVIGPSTGGPFDIRLLTKALSSKGICIQKMEVSPKKLTQDPLTALSEAASGLSADVVFIPPFLKLHEIAEGTVKMEKSTGRKFAEPVIPLGEAGKRFSDALGRVASNNGVRQLSHTYVDRIDPNGKDICLRLSSGHTVRNLYCKAAVICGGGIVGGGLGVTGRDVIDPLGLMDIYTPEGATGVIERALASGIRTGQDLAVHVKGVKMKNMFAAGACLPGCNVVMGAGIGTAMALGVIASEKAVEAIR